METRVCEHSVDNFFFFCDRKGVAANWTGFAYCNNNNLRPNNGYFKRLSLKVLSALPDHEEGERRGGVTNLLTQMFLSDCINIHQYIDAQLHL